MAKQFLIQINEDPARAITLEKVQRILRAQWAFAPIAWQVIEVPDEFVEELAAKMLSRERPEAD